MNQRRNEWKEWNENGHDDPVSWPAMMIYMVNVSLEEDVPLYTYTYTDLHFVSVCIKYQDVSCGVKPRQHF